VRCRLGTGRKTTAPALPSWPLAWRLSGQRCRVLSWQNRNSCVAAPAPVNSTLDHKPRVCVGLRISFGVAILGIGERRLPTGVLRKLAFPIVAALLAAMHLFGTRVGVSSNAAYARPLVRLLRTFIRGLGDGTQSYPHSRARHGLAALVL